MVRREGIERRGGRWSAGRGGQVPRADPRKIRARRPPALFLRPPLGRRHHRPGEVARGAGAVAVGRAERADRGDEGSASSGCNPPPNQEGTIHALLAGRRLSVHPCEDPGPLLGGVHGSRRRGPARSWSMDCSGCGFQIESGFAFCPKCGVRQPIACSSCGYLCAPDFAFCPKCGASVGAAARAPSRLRPYQPGLRPQSRNAAAASERRNRDGSPRSPSPMPIAGR